MGQNMGQKCGLAMGQPNRQLSPPNLDLRHIQDHFGFTFPIVALTRFSEGFSLPVFEPSAESRMFFASAGNLLPQFQHGSITWVRPFSLSPAPTLFPAPKPLRLYSYISKTYMPRVSSYKLQLFPKRKQFKILPQVVEIVP